MSDPDFDFFCRVTHDRSGLVLGEDKRYLVDGRLLPIAVAEGLGNVSQLLTKLRNGGTDSLIRRCVDAMATHETSFFRDRLPFDQLITTVLPNVLEHNARTRSFKIWSAACSTGQEPYSIAMTLMHNAPELAGWNIEILATDLTEEPLSQARAGHYSAFEIRRGLTEAEIAKNFRRVSENGWEVLPQLKRWITFRTHNLLDSYVSFGPFDLILCRNVLIYFGRQTKVDVLAKLASALQPRGMLMLGSAETVVGLSHAFTILKGARGIYQHAKSPIELPKLYTPI